jgi:hypothetical protein
MPTTSAKISVFQVLRAALSAKVVAPSLVVNSQPGRSPLKISIYPHASIHAVFNLMRIQHKMSISAVQTHMLQVPMLRMAALEVGEIKQSIIAINLTVIAVVTLSGRRITAK